MKTKLHSSKSNNFALKLFVLALGLSLSTYSFSIDYYQRQSGAWENPLTWTTSPNFNATTNTGTYPKAGDNVYFANNGNAATIYLQRNVEVNNMYFNNASATVVIEQNNYDIVITSTLSVDWTTNVSIVQTTGYLQVNGSIDPLRTDRTIKNFRVGSASFAFTQTNSVQLTVTDNYDYYCYQSTIPTAINATAATKLNIASSCSPSFVQPSTIAYGDVCVGESSLTQHFELHGFGLQAGTITVGPAANFTFATSALGTYSNQLSFDLATNGHLRQNVFVKFTAPAAQAYNSSFPVTGGGTSMNVQTTATGSTNIKPSIHSQWVKYLSPSSVRLNAYIPKVGCGSDKVVERGFYYSLTSGFVPSAASKVKEYGSFDNGIFRIDVDNLQKNQVYYYRAYAVNSAGETLSSEGTFTIKSRKYYSRSTGNWESLDRWTTQSCGGTLNSGFYPGPLDTVIICQEHIITVNSENSGCIYLDMSAYKTQLILKTDFDVFGNVVVSNQSEIHVGNNNLTIQGEYTNLPNEYLSSINYTDGTVRIDGNIHVKKNNREPFNCTGTGWLRFEGNKMTLNSDISVPRFKQPTSVYKVNGNGTITVTNVFDQSFSFDPPSKVIISIPANTINKPTLIYSSTKSGAWNDATAWEKSTNGGDSWTAASTWPQLTTDIVRISATHTISNNSNLSIGVLQVDSLGTYYGLPASELSLSTILGIDGTIQLSSNASGTASLILPSIVAGSGKIEYSQTFAQNRNYYISLGFGAINLPSGPTYFKYVESTQSNNNADYWQSTTNSLGAAQGFILKPNNTNETYSFSGPANNDTIQVKLSQLGLVKTGFNLIGNPYLSYIDGGMLAMDGLESTIWVRTHTGSSYNFNTVNTQTGIGTFGQTLIMPPMQGFWVRTTNAQRLTFTNDMRRSGETTLLKAKKASTIPLISLQVLSGSFTDETIIYEFPNATVGKDIYDSQKMSNENNSIPELYTLAQSERLAINALPSLAANSQIALGFKTAIAGSAFKIKLNRFENFDPSIKIYLLDGSKTINLSSETEYSFSSGVYDNTDRFKVVLSTDNLTSNPETSDNETLVYVDKNGNIHITRDNSDACNFKLFSLDGKILSASVLNEKYSVIDTKIKKGLYIVRLTNHNQEFSKKIVF